MAADGSWTRAGEPPLEGGEGARPSLKELAPLLALLEARLARPDPEPVPAAAVAELVRGLEALTRRVARAEEISADRIASLQAAVGRLSFQLEIQRAHSARLETLVAEAEARLSERLDEIAAEAEARRERRAFPARSVLVGVVVLAALGLAAAYAA